MSLSPLQTLRKIVWIRQRKIINDRYEQLRYQRMLHLEPIYHTPVRGNS